MKIGVNPATSSENEYVRRVTFILGKLGEVQPLPGVKRALLLPHKILRSRRDYAILHWLENTMLDEHGRLSSWRLARLYAYIFLLRLTTKSLILVRHNNYPHAADPADMPRIVRALERYEKKFDSVVTHSGHNTAEGYSYVPHPLYTKTTPSPGRVIDGDYFLVFGRLLPYKNVDRLIANLGPETHLVVAGKAADISYLEECRKQADGKRVTFITHHVDDGIAANLATHCNGIVVCNCDKDMVVSGTYFYALTYGRPIYTLRTPFVDWLYNNIAPGGLHVYDDLPLLAAGLADGEGLSKVDSSKVCSAFGDDAVAEAWRSLLQAREPA